MSYDHKSIETKWQKVWEENKTFATDAWDFSKPKFYALDMFPYPSGVGLHAGHPEGYTATDIVSRMKRMQGYNVLHPMGFDSFGLPAEQYAIQTGNNPNGFTLKNIETFKRQLKMLGFSYDWDREVSTCDPSFYKWTQWIFKQLFESGLAKCVEMPVNWCEELGTVLANDEVIDGKIMKQSIREIKIEDLLGRPEIKISMEEIVANFKDKTILVTGAAGSIGSELCRQLATFGIRELILYDNGETPMHNLRLELEERYPNLKFIPVIGDVRIPARLDFVFRTYHPQVVFHAAAYKHVPLMEENPCEAVLVNVAGTRNVADKCIEYDVEKMVMISTDKAVNPTNVMGCTKRLAEIYVQSLGLSIEQGTMKGKTKFVTTRFGNVLGSNGSVIPRFREQIAKGGPVTVTHPEITRFFMTIPEACRLVMEAATMSTGNQIFVFDMGESVKIAHLARRMIELAGFEPDKDIKIEYTGLRPGEKLYEEVLSNKENTEPTLHDRIRIAKVREYDYREACGVAEELESLSRSVCIPDMIRLMKRTVPEFKSKNSKYEIYDREEVRIEAQ